MELEFGLNDVAKVCVTVVVSVGIVCYTYLGKKAIEYSTKSEIEYQKAMSKINDTIKKHSH